jgi:D-arginine dehydrogenase
MLLNIQQHILFALEWVFSQYISEVAGNMEQFDIIIVGGGMAGISVGYELASEASVLILEQEENPGLHATGRSAAVYAASYGSDRPALFALSQASASFFECPPPGFCEHPLLSPRGVMYIAHEQKLSQLRQSFERMRQVNHSLQWLDEAAIKEKVPLLRTEYAKQAMYEEQAYDIDVHGLQEGYLKGIRHSGGTLRTHQQVQGLEHHQGQWSVICQQNTYKAPVIINAAGAWADKIAELADVPQIGLTPLRRTAVLLEPPEQAQISRWPLMVEFEETFYLKPDAGKVLASPADESLSAPCDSQPEEIDVAYAAHYAETALQMQVRKVDHSWSGLRSFVSDRTPVIGYCEKTPGFFWLAGQGGYGIQTAPAAAKLAASLVLNRGVPETIADLGLMQAAVSPARFEGAGSNA